MNNEDSLSARESDREGLVGAVGGRNLTNLDLGECVSGGLSGEGRVMRSWWMSGPTREDSDAVRLSFWLSRDLRWNSSDGRPEV